MANAAVQHISTRVVVLFLVALAIALAASGGLWRNNDANKTADAASWLQRQSTASLPGQQSCRAWPQFVSYTPSAWESEWLKTFGASQEVEPAVCPPLVNDARVDTWLETAAAWQRGGAALSPPNPAVFSTLTFRSPCSQEEYQEYIEPLVGHFRHPHSLQACLKGGQQPVQIEDRGYVLPSGMRPEVFRRNFPGRRLLFDLGTSIYPTSLKWFVDTYSTLGIDFDEIWAWELRPFDQQNYWADVPAAMKPKLHFYNTGFDADVLSPFHPTNIILKVTKPGDFVFVKLDIDHVDLELGFMAVVEKDPELRTMINEMAFEMHYDHVDMRKWFGVTTSTTVSANNVTYYADVLKMFHKMRSLGLKLHYWP